MTTTKTTLKITLPAKATDVQIEAIRFTCAELADTVEIVRGRRKSPLIEADTEQSGMFAQARVGAALAW